MKKTALASIGVCIIIMVSIGSELWALSIVYALLGYWAVFLALLLFPGTICLVPWYLLFVYGNWQLLAFTYGGFLVGGLVFSMGDDGSDEHTDSVKTACNMKTGASASQSPPTAISDCTETIEIGPRDAKAYDNREPAHAKNRGEN